MAYFPNGTSFAGWQEENCMDCLNYRDNGSGSLGCAVTDAHWLHANKMHKDGKRTDVFEVLSTLIPDDGPEQHNCQMRLTAEDLEKDDLRRRADDDRVRYDAAMAEIRP